MSPQTRLSVALAVAAASMSIDAAAESPAPQPPLSWSALPTGHLSAPPPAKTGPAAIPAGQRAEGIWIALPPAESRSEGSFVAYVMTSEKRARAFAKGTFEQDDSDEPSCTTSTSMMGSIEEDDPQWPAMTQSMEALSWEAPRAEETPEVRAMRPSRVTAVHVERVVRGEAGRATLEWTDAWVDVVSHGSRTIAKGSLLLVRVATGPAGLEVFAARDEGRVHFVVRAGDPPPGDQAQLVRATARQMSAHLPGVFASGHSDCGFLRATLSVSLHGAEMATVSTTAVLPPIEVDVGDSVPKKVRIGRGFADLRRRPLLVNLSASQASADPQPVLSVSMAWGAREGT